MSETEAKSMVSRRAAIALGIICIVLAISLVGATSTMNDQNNIINYQASMINDKNNIINNMNSVIIDNHNTISSLNSQISSLNLSIEWMNSQISDLNDSNEYLQNQIDCLFNITTLENRTIVSDLTRDPTEYWVESVGVEYSGYMTVWVQTSAPDNSLLRASWSTSGINYDKTVCLGTSTKMAFPVLPTRVKIEIEHATAVFTCILTLYY